MAIEYGSHRGILHYLYAHKNCTFLLCLAVNGGGGWIVYLLLSFVFFYSYSVWVFEGNFYWFAHLDGYCDMLTNGMRATMQNHMIISGYAQCLWH